jgi:hypothetical protein
VHGPRRTTAPPGPLFALGADEREGTAPVSTLARYFGEMDSENDLRRAEELVAEGRRIVRQQRGRIIRLRAAGIDSLDAERAFRLFEANLRALRRAPKRSQAGVISSTLGDLKESPESAHRGTIATV